MRRAFTLAFCLAAAGCSAARDGAVEPASARPRSPLDLQRSLTPPLVGRASERARSPLSLRQRRAMPLSPAWMVGYWAYGGYGRNCAFEGETSLWPDGTYTMSDGFGRWSFSGDTLTIIEERPPSVQYMQVRLGDAGSSTIRKIGPDAITAQWEEGPASRFYRCDPR